MLLRTLAVDKLACNMEARTVDAMITPLKKLDVTLIARHRIEKISAFAGVLAAKHQPGRADCDLHMPE